MRVLSHGLTLASALTLTLLAVPCEAQRIDGRHYIVARGDTVSEIALALHVSSASLIERNHLVPPYALRNGQRLRLPNEVSDEVVRSLGGTPVPTMHASPPVQAHATNSSRVASNGRNGGIAGRSGGGRWGRPSIQGYVRLVRESTGEQMSVSLRRVTNTGLNRMRHFLRYGDGRTHTIHPRLLRLLAQVSDHFGGRRVHVISGYRPFRRGQWTAHSNHNVGHAMDMRVEGVPNRVLRDFCRTLPQTGCGFYPRSVFVHMDVRSESAAWVDWSRPGQRPQYGRDGHPPVVGQPPVAPPAGGGEDESVEDVAQDNQRVREATTVEDNDDDAPGPPSSGTPSAAPTTP
ncbi:MAG: DUF882 domain-containing protein [Deltaproteobacteria bacterium]|nr:DUF882 domain-containing protein [Deltaproteobacteria bacterium]